MDQAEAREIIDVLSNKESKAFLSDDEKFQRKEALRYLSEIEGDSQAMAFLGGIYYEEENYPLAEKYYLSSYESGNKEVASGLGYIYFYGRVDKPDYQKAMFYFTEASKLGDLESEMKIADMYRKGLGVEASKEEYEKRIRSLWEKVKNDQDLFSPLPELSHRLASLDIEEGKVEEAKILLKRGRFYIVYRIKYNAFWGNFIVARRIEELMHELQMIDYEHPLLFDLFPLLKEPSSFVLNYGGKTYQIASFYDEGKIRVRFNEKDFASIEDFLRKASIGEMPLYLLESKNNYFITRAEHE